MVRVLGIDPGTRSMDLCGLEDGGVVYERSLDNAELVKRPNLFREAVEEALPVDLIAGPSGYGVELTRIEEVPEERFEQWYYNYILLTTKEEVLKAIEGGLFGAILYRNMTEACLWMRKERLPVVFIPSVVELPTVPEFRKANKLDMGTADKMAVAVLGVHSQASRLGIPYREVSFILIELGFGYNAVLGVEGGKIVDGIGGTTFPGIGFLTASSLDGELVQLVGRWERGDVFVGGAATITGEMDPERFVEGRGERFELAFEAMMEGIEKAVTSVRVSVKRPRELLVSGRLTRIRRIREELERRLGEVREVGGLEGARLTKETAQGYAVVADGLAGGRFRELVEWMGIREAKGTALDHLHHPKARGIGERFVRFKG
ncbi:MAG: DUF1464 family protein [Candidatus Hadarchaeales archaeon]